MQWSMSLSNVSKIAYGFSNCSNREYQQLLSENRLFVMVTDQKYHGLLLRGLIQNGAIEYIT